MPPRNPLPSPGHQSAEQFDLPSQPLGPQPRAVQFSIGLRRSKSGLGPASYNRSARANGCCQSASREDGASGGPGGGGGGSCRPLRCAPATPAAAPPSPSDPSSATAARGAAVAMVWKLCGW